MSLHDYLRVHRLAVNAALDRLLPPADEPPGTIHAAMRHSVFAGGKRVRPILAIAAAEACGDASRVLKAACALECVHTYSLIHDDLPALDNDDLRRGRPTCHRAYGEAVAILAGDALLTLAFRIVAGLDLPAEARAALVAELSAAGGTPEGMIGGQVADLEAQGREPSAGQVDYIHRAKTGALIRASVRFGGICAGTGARQLAALGRFGRRIGLAFQIVDDILDVVASSEQLGKTAGKDAEQDKSTYPALYGIDGSRARADRCLREALAAIGPLGEPGRALRDIARFIVERTA